MLARRACVQPNSLAWLPRDIGTCRVLPWKGLQCVSPLGGCQFEASLALRLLSAPAPAQDRPGCWSMERRGRRRGGSRGPLAHHRGSSFRRPRLPPSRSTETLRKSPGRQARWPSWLPAQSGLRPRVFRWVRCRIPPRLWRQMQASNRGWSCAAPLDEAGAAASWRCTAAEQGAALADPAFHRPVIRRGKVPGTGAHPVLRAPWRRLPGGGLRPPACPDAGLLRPGVVTSRRPPKQTGLMAGEGQR